MDNYFKNCPPVMSDGRHFTDYKSDTRRNEYIKYINDVLRDDDYRMLLQCNGTKFMDKEWDYYTKKMSCWENTCVHNYPTRVLPQFFPQELQAFNDSMNPSKPKLKNTCPVFRDYRLTSEQSGLICGDKEKQNTHLTKTKNIKPEELLSNFNRVSRHPKRMAMSESNPVGMETMPSYASLASEELHVPNVSAMSNHIGAPSPNMLSQIYDPEMRNSEEH